MPLARRTFLAAAASLSVHASDWIPLFDGQSLEGWKIAPIPGHGGVSVKDGAIHLGSGSMTGIACTREFPRLDYEIRYEAARLEGNDFFAAIVFPIDKTHCCWVHGGWDGMTVGLSNLDGYDASENETSTARDFARGRWYSFHLAVSASRLHGSIDNATVLELDTRGRTLDLRLDDTDLCAPLGFASYRTLGAIRKIEYRRVSV
ncbi:MAG: DUF1080 domain-containing protein [Acidobacteria bacterium]|nr:DUF1080 domain-containing protein [Acidobacteriota bacterium]